MSESGKQKHLLVLLAFIFATLPLLVILATKANAAPIQPRSLTLSTGTVTSDVNSDTIADGGSTPGGNANHAYAFEVETGGSIGSIKFLYCTTASGTCTTPTGLDTTGSNVAIGAQDNNINGFTLNKTTNGSPYLTRTAAAASAEPVTYRLDNIVNPTTPNQTFYVRISTYASTDTTGSPTDTGVVAASTATQIVLSGYMPEFLGFCTGETVTVNCGTVTGGGGISFNQEFSPTATRYASSQFAASTNAASGYAITARGPTMTSGSNTITAIGGTATAPAPGTLQFGMNLVDNATPDVGTDITPSSGAATLQAKATTNFATVDQFAFAAATDNIVANSDFDGTSGPTDSQVYTASYIVNVTGSLPPGTYTTTLTYVCTATF